MSSFSCGSAFGGLGLGTTARTGLGLGLRGLGLDDLPLGHLLPGREGLFEISAQRPPIGTSSTANRQVRKEATPGDSSSSMTAT